MDNNSIHSSFTKKSCSSKGRKNGDGDDDFPEESGWTDYFEDFLSEDHLNREYSSNSSGFGMSSNSMVSDAASCAAWNNKFSSNDQHNVNVRLENGCKNLSFSKKRRSRVVVHDHHDDSLEDTASSPVNSPKVSDLRQLDMNPRKKFYENIEISQEKRRNCIELQNRDEERNEILSSMGRENECTELKKRGLCLVPLSMLVNYLG
ncbi:hypothetical protein BVC80_8519g17 [Macleaya cordata]|uniref:Uncharacterized protein n=1 Tax=Macleaya cordata TaxID=56857 RepID=A0A200R0D2_MACCD|nr:hypothetical protein BVC80_8519g17 [Macleaya cordata]